MAMWPSPSPRQSGTVGTPTGAPVQPSMSEILSALTDAFGMLTLQCAVASSGEYNPTVAKLPGFKELHEENYEVSYHLTTAIGSARVILGGSRDPAYVALLVTCERAAREHQQKATAAFRRMAENAPAEFGATMQRLQGLLQGTLGQIQRVRGLLTAALGAERIAQLLEWSRQAERE